jgi:hypothetical protein
VRRVGRVLLFHFSAFIVMRSRSSAVLRQDPVLLGFPRSAKMEKQIEDQWMPRMPPKKTGSIRNLIRLDMGRASSGEASPGVKRRDAVEQR